MPGPIPDPHAKRRNAPTIPTTELPVSGRSERPPTCPVKLGKAGRKWWNWAWKTPQATGWSAGNVYTVAHRAQLEDDLAALDEFDSAGDLLDLIGCGENYADVVRQVGWIMGRLRGLAGDRVKVAKAATELEDRLGLTPKGMASLRWQIVEDPEADPVPATGEGSDPDDEVAAARAKRREAIS